jgi:hypothetical protein
LRFEIKKTPLLKNALAYYSAGGVVVNSGTNPKTLSYKASVVKIYRTNNSMTLFKNKNNFSLT